MTALILIPLAAWSVETSPLDKLFETAAEAQGDSYLTARNAIVSLGTNTLPFLVLTGNDMSKPWQQRLVARICYERIINGHNIDALRQYDWRSHLGYNAQWEGSMVILTMPVKHLTACRLYMNSTDSIYSGITQ